MFKKILKILRKIIVSAFFIYGYNIVAAPLGLIIPINIITVLAVSIFGIPAILSFIIILVLIF